MQLKFGRFIGRITRRATSPAVAVSEVFDHDIPEVPRHTHDDDHFLMVLRGAYLTEARSSTTLVGPTSVIFNPAGTTHRDRFRSRGGRFMTISLDTDTAHSLRHEAAMRERAVLFEDAPENWLLTRLYHEFCAPDALTENVLESAALELFGRMARAPEHATHAPTWLGRARELIEDRVTEAVRVQEIARELDVHPFHLTRTFRRYFNCTTGEYLRHCRLARAAALLRNTADSLSAVAHQTGYPDQSHLTKSFRKQTGFTPRGYRRAFGTETGAAMLG